MPGNNNVVWLIVGILLIVVLLFWLITNLGGDGDAAVESARAVARSLRDGPRFS
jgi:hypothetical protein